MNTNDDAFVFEENELTYLFDDNSLRGIGGSWIILEEAAYLSDEIWTNVAAPLLVKRETCFLALSTLSHKKHNKFNMLMNQNIGATYRVTYICDKCQKAAKLSGEHVSKCRHNQDSVPHYIDDSKYDKIKVFFGLGKERDYLIETQGLDPEDEDPFVFKTEDVDHLVTGPRTVPDEPIKVLFHSIDPVAGTDIADKITSEFAIVTIASPGNMIMGMEALDVVDPEDYEEILLSHIRRIRALEHCSGALSVVDVESGTGIEAGHIRKLVSKHFTNVVYMTDFMRKPGRKTNMGVKHEMARITQTFLKSRALSFHRSWVTHHKNPKELLDKLRLQLCTYSRIVKVHKHSSNTVLYSGKGENKKELDDLAVTLQKALIARDDFYTDLKYSNHH